MKALLLILLISLSSCKANWFYDVGASRHLPTSDSTEIANWKAHEPLEWAAHLRKVEKYNKKQRQNEN